MASVADTDAARARGLMFRDTLRDDEGMLFVFGDSRRHPFWMRNVLIALDMIWVDDEGRIVWLVESAPPCVEEPCPIYTPQRPASSVIEVRAGFAKRHGIKAGDIVRFENTDGGAAL
jgi:uncharacterized membrane protein (UPF0127 family)